MVTASSATEMEKAEPAEVAGMKKTEISMRVGWLQVEASVWKLDVVG